MSKNKSAAKYDSMIVAVGNDRILSSAFNDAVYGGVGNDWLDGGTRSDFASVAANDKEWRMVA